MLAIALMFAVTFFEKGAPLWLLGTRKMNPHAERWLGFVPAAVLAALLFPEILLREAADGATVLFLSRENIFLIASIPSLAIALWKRSFFGAITAGIATVALLRLLL